MAKQKEDNKGITVKKADDTAEWYSQVVVKADVADYTPVRGCMVIKPYGYALWQSLVDFLDALIKEQGVENAYFPLFIPESFFTREAEHAEGFKPEVAWVEKKNDEGERLAVRPTSETIMYDSYGKWIRSWRDLPLKMNQWCNVVRWEVKDVKMFLRSREFLWQEGHCVYETQEERNKETQLYLDIYRQVAEDLFAVPVFTGPKSKRERFAGADRTYTIESRMPDGKALQMGTSHDLSQGFAKSFNINFIGKDEKEHLPFQNSWGMSTRMLGALILTHGDDKGLVLPPRAAPIQAVIVPILFEDSKDEVLAKADEIKTSLAKLCIKTKLDDRDEVSPGWKFNEWEMKGVPVRLELGPKDLEKESVMVVRRDTNEKTPMKIVDLDKELPKLFEKIQKDMFDAAKKRWEENIVSVDEWDDFLKAIEKKKFVLACHCGDEECEGLIKEETVGVTTRVVKCPAKGKKCIKCGKPAEYEVYFAKAY